MMKVEAEALLNRELTEEEFERMNFVYMESRLSKQIFCKEWNTLKNSVVVKDLADLCHTYNHANREMIGVYHDVVNFWKDVKAQLSKAVQIVVHELNNTTTIVYIPKLLEGSDVAAGNYRQFVDDKEFAGIIYPRPMDKIAEYDSPYQVPDMVVALLKLLGFTHVIRQ